MPTLVIGYARENQEPVQSLSNVFTCAPCLSCAVAYTITHVTIPEVKAFVRRALNIGLTDDEASTLFLDKPGKQTKHGIIQGKQKSTIKLSLTDFRNKWIEFQAKMWFKTALLLIGFVVYPSTSQLCFAVFSCRDYGEGVAYHRLDANVNCNSMEYYILACINWFVIAGFVCGLPAYWLRKILSQSSIGRATTLRVNVGECLGKL